MTIFGYARTTINDNDLDSQVKSLTEYGCGPVFLDTFEQKYHEENHADLDTVIAQMQPGDALVVCDLHRLGRSTRQLTELTSLFKNRNLHLVSLTENIDTRSEMGDIYFNLMEGLAQMECALIKERTLVGLNKARQKGKIGGRPKIDVKTVKKIRQLYYDKKETIQFISSKCGVSVGTCYKYINLAPEELEKITN
ncbi:resolvase [Enterococcus saigonensis]|uniref:Resolvase n=1 Tax=Enterococcus saigonensis TaxID=1805431 RepID=A0A679IEK0_9ENTE|nr:recombinase family protein [Enterococcus saigonensis]BCA86799.1 resolvase [Enterococcus saigonensis]